MAQLPLQLDESPAKAPTRLPSYIAGHRKRLRERFVEGGASAMPDYELLELILFRAIRQGDVKPVARRLIDTFGDFSLVISAPVTQLTGIEGVGEAVATELKIIEARRPSSGAETGSIPPRDLELGRPARLCPHRHGAWIGRDVPHALP